MAKERIIYNNYDLCNMFDDARAFLLEEHDKPLGQSEQGLTKAIAGFLGKQMES